MKIKTITCHNVYNFGASLQAHALMHYLKSLGHDVEIINYMPEYIRKAQSLWAIGPRWNRNLFIKLAFYAYVVPIRLAQRKMRANFDKFTSKYLKLTNLYKSFDELQKDVPQADVYFCGSDQIWNPVMDNGKDPAFYLDFAPSKSIRAAYAASFAVKEIPQGYRGFVTDELSKMDFISVREKTGADIVRYLAPDKECTHVVDPVFLPNQEHWLEMTYKPNYGKYILVYDQENNATIKELAIYFAKKLNCKIVAFKDLYPRRYADIQIKDAGPIDFISLIANAEMVITNSFHCTAFSLIMERQFFVVPRTQQKVNSRMADLLETLGISQRLVDSIETADKAERVDYDGVSDIIKSMKTTSYEYINKVLSSHKG